MVMGAMAEDPGRIVARARFMSADGFEGWDDVSDIDTAGG